MKSISSERGMTLLELMIAIAIFAVAAIASLQSYLATVRHFQIINEEKNIVLLAGMKTEEMKTGITKIAGEQSGSFPEPYDKYAWEVSLSEFSITDTEYGTTFLPYSLKVQTVSGSYSLVIPFLEIMEHEAVRAESP